jgi:integrase
MGIYARPNSPFWWMNLERPGQRCLRQSTGVPVDGGTVEQTKLNQQLAQRIYGAAKGDVARGQFQLCIPKPTILFRDFRAWFEREVLPRKRNQVRDRSMLRQLGHSFDNVYLHDITRPQIEEWITARGNQVSPGTVNRELTRLKSFLSAAVPTYLDGSPAARIRDVDEDEFEARILEEADEKKLLLAATAEERALVVCALDTLQRLSNVAALERDQDHGAYLTVLRAKGTGKRRYYEVPVSPRLRRALDALPKNGAKYFRSYQGGTIEAVRKRVEQAFAALCGRAGVPYGRKIGGLTFHCLRHTGASRMLNRGADIKTVAEIGNWKDWRILQRYLHPIGDARERAVALVGAHVHPVNPKPCKPRK